MTTVPPVEQGRSAWSIIGKSNGSRYYTFIEGKPLDGSSAAKDVNFQAVNLGVLAIQERVNALTGAGLVEDGLFGAKTAAAVRTAQAALGVKEDGVVGPSTCHQLWRPLVQWIATSRSLDFHHTGGILVQESANDPGAVGGVTPGDRGVMQINLMVHTVTPEQAFDPVFAIDWTVNRLKVAWQRYSGKGSDLQIHCHIASHNSPLNADQWYRDAKPPNTRIADYVARVLEKAAAY